MKNLIFIAALLHHSFSAEYNITAPVVVKGEVTQIAWSNPHVFLVIAAKDSIGTLQEWHVEGGSVSAMTEAGWKLELLQQLGKSHNMVTVTGYRGRSGFVSSQTPPGSHWIEAWGKDMELPDGRKLAFN